MKEIKVTSVKSWLLLLGMILALCIIGAGAVQAGKKSDRNKADCSQWCSQNRESGCEQCTSYKGCGSGYTSMKKFGKMASWHACRKNNFGKRGEKNERDCKTYCKSNPACVKCTSRPCGKGIKLLKAFRESGKDWFACEKTNWAEHSQEARSKADKWCADYRQSTGEKCRIVKSGQSCPKGFYKSERLKVTWGRDYKACLAKKIDSQRVKDCSGAATANIEKALSWLDANYETILRGYRLQPNDYRNRRAHDRMDRKFPKITVTCEDHRKKCQKSGAPLGWSASVRKVHLCYKKQSRFCGLVKTIIHEAGHNAWADMEWNQHHGTAGSADDTVHVLGHRAQDLCTGTNSRGTNIVPAGSRSYGFRLR